MSALFELEPGLAAPGGLVAGAGAVQSFEHEALGASRKGFHEVGADAAVPGRQLLGPLWGVYGELYKHSW